MFNKKRLLAMAMSSAMIMTSLAGCSSSTASSAAETSKEAEKTTEADTTTAPEETTTEAETTADVKVEPGKGIDFEDGNLGFIKLNVMTPDADEPDLSIVDFNGSKALKVTPKSELSGKIETLGFDVSSLLGDKVADVASVSFDIAVEAADGKFHAVTGNVYQNYDAGATTSWSVFSKNSNPNTIKVDFNNSYDASRKNVFMISKFGDAGNNSDTAYAKTGKYSTLYIDNIIFADKDGNALDVDSTVAFDAPEGFGECDWSNLIKVSDQVVIPGFQVSGQGAWNQGPASQMVNMVTKEKLDDDGNPVLDADGNPEMVTDGVFDWGSIIKPGLVLTFYYNAEFGDPENENAQVPFWIVTGDWSENGLWGWTRLPHTQDAKLNYGVESLVNDSKSMMQITYDQLKNGFEELAGMPIEEIDLPNRSFMMQVEGLCNSLTVSCVTYAYAE